MNIRALLTVCLSIFCLASVSSVYGHEIRPAIVDLTLDEKLHFSLAIDANLEALIADIGAEHKDTTESVNAQAYERLRALAADELEPLFLAFLPQLIEGISLNADTRPVPLEYHSVDIPGVGDLGKARSSVIVFKGQFPATTKAVTWGWNQRFGPNALRVSTADKQDFYTIYLTNGQKSEAIELQAIAPQSVSSVAWNYLVIGFEHIIPKGLDHILFVVGLFLLSTRLKPLIWQISSFTVAHTVTLALGMLGVANLPPEIVEPLIAASIVYVCVENIFSEHLKKWRPLLVFAFGLLHGLGFAGVLSEIGLSQEYFVTGLIAFNIGVELGQLTVILLCFVAIGFWFSRKPWYRQRVTIPLSAIIALVGCYWVLERTLL